MRQPTLVAIDKKYRDSYIEALQEGLGLHPPSSDSLAAVKNDFEGWMNQKFDLTLTYLGYDGRAYKKAPFSEYWLVEGDRFLGYIGLRHELSNPELETVGGHIGFAVRVSERRKGYGKLMLRLVIPYAKSLGIERALLTVRDDNVGSIRIIEGAGAVSKILSCFPDATCPSEDIGSHCN